MKITVNRDCEGRSEESEASNLAGHSDLHKGIRVGVHHESISSCGEDQKVECLLLM